MTVFSLPKYGALAERIEGIQEQVPDITRDPDIILQLAHQVLGMSAVFYAHLDAKYMTLMRTFRDPGHPHAPNIADGAVVPLQDTYCQFVYRSAKPLVVTDSRTTAPFADLATTRELGFGSYVGVPLINKDGSIFGSLCGTDEAPTFLTSDQVVTLQLLGQALVAGLEHGALLAELEGQRASAALALRDALTGLPNRRAFDSALEAGIARAASDHRPYSVLFIDIDHFKRVNDAYGHDVGDTALRFVATRLMHALRSNDQLFRFGGEEMVALLPGTTATAAMVTAQRLRRAIGTARPAPTDLFYGQPLRLPEGLSLTISVGVATYPQDAANSTELLRCADAAMYHAKHAGRNRCCAANLITSDTPMPNTQTYAIEVSEQGIIANGLIAALGAHDPTTSEHSDRIPELTMRLMDKLTGDAKKVRLAGVAARLHDIGKVGVSAEILTKVAPLSDDEWQIMRRHPHIGERILQECGGTMDLVAQVVGAHHERWDGKGYPQGLHGDDIPLAARIIAVVDAFDAMTSNRPYRRALPLAAAFAELRQGAGTQFDPNVVAAFLAELGVSDETTSIAA